DGPNPLTSQDYAEDFNQVKLLGSINSTARTPAQMTEALFWTDHDLRQWNDGMLRLAGNRGLDLVQTARMLAMAHVAGGDAMIARTLAGFHLRNSCEEGSNLGREVSRYVVEHYFQPLD